MKVLYEWYWLLLIGSVLWLPQKYEAAKLLINIDNNQKCFLAANQHIRMRSEGSCDTEDWSNDAENSALITEINCTYNYFYTENICKKIILV